MKKIQNLVVLTLTTLTLVVFVNNSYGEWKDAAKKGAKKGVKEGVKIATDQNDTYGEGAITLSNGTKYEGKLKNGEPHGEGTAISPSGVKYVGPWKDGKMNGQGTMSWPDGAKYVGQFKNGNRHGQGALYDPNGRIIESGTYQNDKYVNQSDADQQGQDAPDGKGKKGKEK
jgi:hypothetical protein